MKFNKYDDINLFWKDNQKLLEEKEWYNCLMIGNCLEGIRNGTDGWLFATIENDNTEVELIIFNRKPWKLLIYSPTNNYSDEILKFAANELYKYDKELLGINAEKSIANTFAKYYCELANMEYKIHITLRILLLENIKENPDLIDDIIFREININDKDILIQYIKDFTCEALHEELSKELAEEKFNKHLEKGFYYVLEKDGKIVSQAGLSRIMKYGKCVSAVYTPQEERKKGYAYNLVYKISKMQLDKGDKYCVLYTDDSNPISNYVYEKIGYKRMGDWNDLDFVKKV